MTPKVEFAEYSRLKASNDQITVTKATVIQDREFYEHDALRSFDLRYRELPEYYDEPFQHIPRNNQASLGVRLSE